MTASELWSKTWPILFALLFFGVIIMIHECGHFACAKLFKVKVNEFSLGMGPALFKKRKGDTLYAVRLFPIGGYVAMEGEDDASEDERAFNKKPVWQKMIIVVAGALMNLSEEAPDAEGDYYEGAWAGATMTGNGIEEGAYGFPWYVNDGPTYWNTELMQQCGLDPNAVPTTWDEYFAAGETIAKNCDGIYLATTMGSNTEDYVTAGATWMNDDHSAYTFNDEAGVKQLQNFIDLYNEGGIPPEALDSSWSQQSDFFQRGSLVAMAGSAYSADGFKQNSPDLYEKLTVGPRITNDGKSASVSYELLGISSQSKYPDVAIDFARFVTNAENQVEFAKQAAVFPSAQGGLEDEYYQNIDTSTLEGKALQITLDQVKNGYSSRPAEFTDANGYKYLQQQVALAMQGEQTAQEALDKTVEYANERLAR